MISFIIIDNRELMRTTIHKKWLDKITAIIEDSKLQTIPAKGLAWLNRRLLLMFHALKQEVVEG